ncbi:cytochrome bd oxidase small subunit CydS [Lysinibacillus sp. 3P01SB]
MTDFVIFQAPFIILILSVIAAFVVSTRTEWIEDEKDDSQ